MIRVRLAEDAAERISTAAGELLRAGPAQDRSGAVLAELGAILLSALPADLVRAVHRYADTGGTTDTLLIGGLLPQQAPLQPTPRSPVPELLDDGTRRAELALLAVMSLLGRPFTFATLYEGLLVQHVVPVLGQEDAQTSGGSGSFLQWHVEDAFTDERCDHAGLLCLRAHPEAVTLFAPIRAAHLDPAHSAVLRQARFVVPPDLAHGQDATGVEPGPVLSGLTSDPEICFDAVYQRPSDPADQAAAAALKHLEQALTAVGTGHILRPGELLVLDNRRVVHARTSFVPRYDGTDRWLLRAMTCGSLPAHRRRGAVRVLPPTKEGQPIP